MDHLTNNPTRTRGSIVGNAGKLSRFLKFCYSDTWRASVSLVETSRLVVTSVAVCLGSALGTAMGKPTKAGYSKSSTSFRVLVMYCLGPLSPGSGTLSCYLTRRMPQSMGVRCTAQGPLHRGRSGYRRPTRRGSPVRARSCPQGRPEIQIPSYRYRSCPSFCRLPS